MLLIIENAISLCEKQVITLHQIPNLIHVLALHIDCRDMTGSEMQTIRV